MIATLTWIAGFWLAFAVLNIVLAGMFAGAETGVYRLNRMRLELACDAGVSSAKVLRDLLGKMDATLAMLLIGTNIHQYLAVFAISTLFVLAGAGEQAEFYTTLVATPVLFVLKDSVPKALFQKAAERMMTPLAWPLRIADWFYKGIGLTYLVCGFSRGVLWLFGRRGGVADASAFGKIAELLAEGRAVGVLRPSQQQMAHRVMDLSERNLSEILQPLEKVATVPVSIARPAFLAALENVDYSRLIATDPDGRYLGIINVYNVLMDKDEKPPIEWLRNPLRLPVTTSIPAALYRLQHGREHIAIVEDTEGNELGIISLKDLVEPILGSLRAW